MKRNIFNYFCVIFLILISFISVMPVVLVLISSITDNDVLLKYGYSFIPKKISLSAYSYLFETKGVIYRSILISFLLTLCGTIISIFLTIPLGYVLTKRNLLGNKFLNIYVFFTMIFNGGLVPTYINYSQVFGLKNTFWGLLIPNLLMNGFNVYLVRSYFISNVPEEFYEAARIDGSGEIRTFFMIGFPLAQPIVVTIAIFVAITYWNDWINGYIYITRRTDLYSLQNLLNRMIQNLNYLLQNSSTISNTNVGFSSIPNVSIQMALGTLGLLPIIILYPFAQKYFVKGITVGGIK